MYHWADDSIINCNIFGIGAAFIHTQNTQITNGYIFIWLLVVTVRTYNNIRTIELR